jgi:hypothetical protein
MKHHAQFLLDKEKDIPKFQENYIEVYENQIEELEKEIETLTSALNNR